MEGARVGMAWREARAVACVCGLGGETGVSGGCFFTFFRFFFVFWFHAPSE